MERNVTKLDIQPLGANSFMRKYCGKPVMISALLYLAASTPAVADEFDVDLLRLELRLGQPTRILSDELLDISTKEHLKFSDLKVATIDIATRAAQFGPTEKTLIVTSVNTSRLLGIDIQEASKITRRTAYNLGWGPESQLLVAIALDAEKNTPNYHATDGIEFVLNLEPYWRHVAETTHRSVHEVSRENSAAVIGVLTTLFKTFPDEPDVRTKFLQSWGLLGVPLTFGSSYPTFSILRFREDEWSGIVKRYDKGDVLAVPQAMQSRLRQLSAQ